MDRINWLAVIVGAVIFYFWGGLWYGLLFSHQWSTFVGVPPNQSMQSVPMIVAVIVALVLSFGVAVALSHDDDRTVAHGVQFGIFFGVVFFASIMLEQIMFEGRPLGLWLINAGYVLIGLVILGALHGAWKKAPRSKATPASGA